jgi:peroxiredoxin
MRWPGPADIPVGKKTPKTSPLCNLGQNRYLAVVNMKTFLALSAAIALALTAQAAPEIGKPAPDFTLKDLDGKEHKLSDLKGKTVVLEWVNYGCPFVKKHYASKNMQNLQKEATADGVVWLAICSSAPGKQGNETPDTGANLTKELGSNATAYLVDEDGKVGKLYGAKTTPEMFVINKEGNVVYMGAIDDKPAPSPDSIKGAVNYVKAALADIKAGKPVATATTKSYGCSVKY